MKVPNITEESWKKAIVYSKKNFVENFELKRGHRVLVLCCGIGTEAFLIREFVGDSGYVIGLDINEEAINKANKRKIELNYDNVDFIIRDATDIEDYFYQFDRVCCIFGLHFFNYQKSVLDYWSKCLKPDGVLGITEWLKSSSNEVIDGITNIIKNYLNSSDAKKIEPIKYSKPQFDIWSRIEKSIYYYEIIYPEPLIYWEILKNNELYPRINKDIGSKNLANMEKEVLAYIETLKRKPLFEVTRVRQVFAYL